MSVALEGVQQRFVEVDHAVLEKSEAVLVGWEL